VIIERINVSASFSVITVLVQLSDKAGW